MGFSLEQFFIELMETLDASGHDNEWKVRQIRDDAVNAIRYAAECGKLPKHYMYFERQAQEKT